ncbi:hypothetical protein D3C80_726600 [compost metagenome]
MPAKFGMIVAANRSFQSDRPDQLLRSQINTGVALGFFTVNRGGVWLDLLMLPVNPRTDRTLTYLKSISPLQVVLLGVHQAG